jgi:hypothetical protein
MKYRVIQRGKVIGAFRFFFEAWLFVYLDLSAYARIQGPDGDWTVNPSSTN